MPTNTTATASETPTRRIMLFRMPHPYMSLKTIYATQSKALV